MRLGRGYRLRGLLVAIAIVPAILTSLFTSAQASDPRVVSSLGYINRTPLTSHVTASFNSRGASTIVAYISSHPSWSGHPVSILGIRDNVGNSWKALEGPTQWQGSTFTLLSAIYYVNAPVTSVEHNLTIDLIQFSACGDSSVRGIWIRYNCSSVALCDKQHEPWSEIG